MTDASGQGHGTRKNTSGDWRTIEAPLFRRRSRSIALAETPPPPKPCRLTDMLMSQADAFNELIVAPDVARRHPCGRRRESLLRCGTKRGVASLRTARGRRKAWRSDRCSTIARSLLPSRDELNAHTELESVGEPWLRGHLPARRHVEEGARRDGAALSGRAARSAYLYPLGRGGGRRPQPHRREPRLPLRPMVEPRRRRPGDRPRLPHRPEARGAGPKARVRGHRRGEGSITCSSRSAISLRRSSARANSGSPSWTSRSCAASSRSRTTRPPLATTTTRMCPFDPSHAERVLAARCARELRGKIKEQVLDALRVARGAGVEDIAPDAPLGRA